MILTKGGDAMFERFAQFARDVFASAIAALQALMERF